VQWVGNTGAFVYGQAIPARGAFVENGQTVTITTQTSPISAGQRVAIEYTTDNWATTHEVVCTWDKNIGNNSQWYGFLSGVPKGAWVYYYIKADQQGDSTKYDNNGGGNFGFMNRLAPPVKTSPILQWFQTDYKTILKRLPEVVNMGYGAIYLPPPQKSGAGGFSTGYNPVDRFDLGDRWQLGTVKTQYGTAHELQDLIRVAHRLGIEIYCDVVLNHNDNRGSTAITGYPDMIPEDFHIKSSSDPTNWEINFNTATSFSGEMLNNDLVGLADIAHEDGNFNETGPFNIPSYASWNSSGKPTFVREGTMANTYPGQTVVAEDVRQYLNRWMWYLRNVIGFDGFRLDAVKHMPPAFLGYAPDQPGYGNYSNGDVLHKVLTTNPDTTIFGEALSSSAYDLREYLKTGTNVLDFPLFFNLNSIFSSQGLGNLGDAVANGYGLDGATGVPFANGGLGPDQSVSFVQSHDNGPPQSNNQASAFIMTRLGRPLVYYDGNNIQQGNWSNFPKPGREDALKSSGVMKPILDAHNRFARGWLVNRWVTNNLYVYERQVGGIGTLLTGLNSRGDQTAQTVTVNTAFPAGTVLRDLTRQSPDVTVNGSSQVTITVPPNSSPTNSNNATGYVLYAPLGPQPVGAAPVATLSSGEFGSGQISKIGLTTYTNPTGVYGSPETYQAYTVTQYAVNLSVYTDMSGFSATAKLDNGQPMAGRTPMTNSPEGLSDGFVALDKVANGQFRLAGIDTSALEDGLHLIRVRVFKDTGSAPGVYSEFNVFFYVKRGLGSSALPVTGDLTTMGNALTFQSRAPSSQANRLDALFVDNDAQYLYVGLAGTVDASDNLLNGTALWLDKDPGQGTGVRDFSTLNDDSGPANRLLSNPRVTAPSGFGADFGVGVFRQSTLGSAPQTPTIGSPIVPPLMGSQAGVYQVRSDRLDILNRMPGAIAFKPRNGPFDPYSGLQVAIPLKSIYPSGISSPTYIGFLAYLTTTGESGTILPPSNGQRAALGGRPAPQSWVTNQFLPVQGSVVNDPGTNAVNCGSYSTYGIKRATPIYNLAVRATSPKLVAPGFVQQDFTFSVRAPISGPLSIAVNSNVPVIGADGTSLNAPSRPYFVVNGSWTSGQFFTVRVISKSATTNVSQSVQVYQGRGVF